MKKLKIKTSRLIILLVLVFLTVLRVYALIPEQGLEIYALNIGQGDSFLIKTIDKKYILVDGGPGRVGLQELQQVIPFWHRGLDLVILTHPDQDHVGGLPAVLNYYKVSTISYSNIKSDNKAFAKVQNLTLSQNIHHIIPSSENDLKVGCCTMLDTLWPTPEVKVNDFADSPNDISTAFVLIYKNFRMYLGGDLPYQYEEQIFTWSHYDLNIIKPSHHGSKTSTSKKVLELTTPEVAIISAGKDNSYGHPHKEVLDGLKDAGIKIYRTDEQGRVHLSLDE